MTAQTLTWSAGEQDTVNRVIARAVASHPQQVFLDIGDREWTYAQIDHETTRLAHGLCSLGVVKGQTVTTILDNNVDAILCWLAINKLGAISVPVNTAYKGEFLRHQLNDSGSAVVIAEFDYAERVVAIADGLTELRTLLYREKAPEGSMAGKAIAALDDYRLDTTSAIDDDVAPGDLAMLIYTAGTTGPSKGCMISHNYAVNLARQLVKAAGRTQKDVQWTALPLFHMNATSTTILSSALVAGKAAVYKRFSVSNFWPEIERTGATIVSLLGSMIPLLLEAAEVDAAKRCFGQIRVVLGTPFPALLQDKWLARFGSRHMGANSYGITEASVIVSLPHGVDPAPNSSGMRVPDFDVRIVDDNDVELPPGTAGEVICRPLHPHVMFEGYWRRPEDTLKIMRNLWLHTGDIGMFDNDGFFYFIDRKKDYLRRRGENISSYEMETSFRAHEAIEDVAVHAVLSALTEDDVKVTAVLKPGFTLSEEQLCLWAVDRLPYFAVPRYIEFRAELPRNPVGRILKYQLRDEGCTATTWDREKAGLTLTKR
ncbi:MULTISPECIES: AMP-binding protein [unclassified Pseudomonas]|uniref:AMP-binding protein n=1 Tax=unclassified Pseudomonas TaxID=196821 RepID=UPI0039B77053